MIEHRSQLRFTTPDKYQPLADKEAIGKKVQELTNRPDEELTDSDCFELASDILTQATGTHFRGTSSFQWEYEYTDYSIFTKEPAGYPITFKV